MPGETRATSFMSMNDAASSSGAAASGESESASEPSVPSPRPTEATDYRITAPYGVFKAMNRGELNAVKAIVGRKLKMKGNPTRLLRDSRPVNALQAVAVEMAKDGTTQFVDG